MKIPLSAEIEVAQSINFFNFMWFRYTVVIQ